MKQLISRHSVSIFVCSTGTPPNLLDCLESLLVQEPSEGWKLDSVNVIWNLPSAEAHRAAQKISARLSCQLNKVRVPLHHFVEPKRGIPNARNKALDLVKDTDVSWILFIDDDCVARPDLLRQLTHYATVHNAAVVAGGWQIEPAGKISSWIPSDVFGRRDYRVDRVPADDGATLPTAYTRNVLFNIRNQGMAGLRFREIEEGAGGSDALFFYTLSNLGQKIVYARDALVTEFYVGERLDLRWHIRRRIRNAQQRQLRTGITGEKKIPSGAWMVVALEVVKLVVAPAILPTILFSMRARQWIGARILGWAPLIGILLSQLGFVYREYAVTWSKRIAPTKDLRT